MLPPTFFPNLPDEIRRLWLEPIAVEYGWPFQSIDESTEGTKWKYVLGVDVTLRNFAGLMWNLEEIEVSSQGFCRQTIHAINTVREQNTTNKDTMFADVCDTQERFMSCVYYIRKHGVVPEPLVCLMTNEGSIDMLDGHHRMAALTALGIPEGYRIPAWVGRPMKEVENE